MPGLFVSEEICAVSSAKGGGFNFSVKGGKPRATISWMVTTVELQGGAAEGDGLGDDDEDDDDGACDEDGARGGALGVGAGLRAAAISRAGNNGEGGDERGSGPRLRHREA